MPYTINKNYVSDIDKELAEFDRTHPKSSSQLAEIKKYQRIYRLRDHITPQAEKGEDVWENFKA